MELHCYAHMYAKPFSRRSLKYRVPPPLPFSELIFNMPGNLAPAACHLPSPLMFRLCFFVFSGTRVAHSPTPTSAPTPSEFFCAVLHICFSSLFSKFSNYFKIVLIVALFVLVHALATTLGRLLAAAGLPQRYTLVVAIYATWRRRGGGGAGGRKRRMVA